MRRGCDPGSSSRRRARRRTSLPRQDGEGAPAPAPQDERGSDEGGPAAQTGDPATVPVARTSGPYLPLTGIRLTGPASAALLLLMLGAALRGTAAVQARPL